MAPTEYPHTTAIEDQGFILVEAPPFLEEEFYSPFPDNATKPVFTKDESIENEKRSAYLCRHYTSGFL